MNKTIMCKEQLFAKYDQLLLKTQSVLRQYSCPESCNASCCKKNYLGLDREEYKKILKTVDKESANIIKSNSFRSDLFGYYKSISNYPVCPLLINSKCRIYEDRPESCRKFPFETYPDVETGFVLMLSLCPLSINIIHDYAQWYKSRDLKKYNEFMEVYEEHQNMNTSSKSFIQINEKDLDSFIAFLEKR